MTISNERVTRFLAVCLEIKIYPGSAQKGKGIEFLEKRIKECANNPDMIVRDFHRDYLEVYINEDQYDDIFSSERALCFLRMFIYRKIDREYIYFLDDAKEIVSRNIPEGIFERKEYELLFLEYLKFLLKLKGKDYLIVDKLIYNASRSFRARLKDKSDIRWVSKIEGEDLALKISVANKFLYEYYCDPISDISELVLRMDEIFLRGGDCYRSFKRIVDSYRTKKSNNKKGFTKINLGIKSENEKWLQKVADDNGISRSRVIDVIIENNDFLKIEDFFKQRNISKS